MSKTTVKVYFNNGCTTLLYNETTTAEEILKVVIKGRLSLNELRFKNCFRLRAVKLSSPIDEKSTSTEKNFLFSKVDQYVWLRNDQKIKEWLRSIGFEENSEKNEILNYWKLQLRIRYLTNDLNEIKFKDPVTFSYYYEQIKNDFMLYLAPKLNDSSLVSTLLDLGCLEMRRSFQNMHPNVLDKSINYEYLERDVGLKRFFPDIVLAQKPKNLKKLIVKGMKPFENLNESDCMLTYLEKLSYLWKYNEETYKCHLGSTWGVPICVNISFSSGISCFMNNSKEIFQNTKFDKILTILTQLDENNKDGLLKLKILDAKEFIIFKFPNLYEAENMASLIDGYCSFFNKSNSPIWNKFGYESEEPKSPSFSGSFDKKMLNSVILNESDETSSVGRISAGSDSIETKYINQMQCNKLKSEHLIFYEKLGSGQFGDVYRGVYRLSSNQSIEVAIKKLKLESSDLEVAEKSLITTKFLREARIMENFDHPHIIKLIGICMDDSYAIVMELAKFGQLRTYLQINKDQLELVVLILYAYQICSAMAYLESRNFVHRDIAARNVLVVNHECVKLADFGLSRETHENAYLATKCKLPIKWMAPESINFRKFSSQSDVWMYGVCVWEIFSYGMKPFDGIKNVDVIKLIEDKQRLNKPTSCPDELYMVLLKCWEYDGSTRPTFQDLKEAILSVYSIYKEKKLTQSSSNGSSFLSNSSLNSNLSSTNNLNEQGTSTTATMLMMMSLDKSNANASGLVKQKSLLNPTNRLPRSLSPNKHLHGDLSPPPKPNRSKLTNTTFSPTHLAQNKINVDEVIDRRAPNEIESNKKLVSSKSDELNSSNQLNRFDDSSRSVSLNNEDEFKQKENDMLLRNQTLKFIQSISIFIKTLNTNKQQVDEELKSIMISLKQLIELIEMMDENLTDCELINEKVSELDECLNQMVEQLKQNNLETVINSALNMARASNDLYMIITKQL